MCDTGQCDFQACTCLQERQNPELTKVRKIHIECLNEVAHCSQSQCGLEFFANYSSSELPPKSFHLFCACPGGGLVFIPLFHFQFSLLNLTRLVIGSQLYTSIGIDAVIVVASAQLSAEIQPFSLGVNGRMFCTDSLEDLAVHPALNATQTITAENIQVVRLG